MAGTADNWLTTRLSLGPGKLYGNLGGTTNAPWDLATGVRLLLHTDGTPNSTQNPFAVHLGMTESGSEWSAKSSSTNYPVDEFVDPVISRVTGQEILITGSLAQISDFAVQQIINPTATRSDVGGSEGMTWGSNSPTIVYRSFAVIWPVEGSATQWHVFHIYKGYNDQGMAAQITRTKLGFSPFVIRGFPITTRTDGDYTARFFRQVSGAS
jgi:hypothetical protein